MYSELNETIGEIKGATFVTPDEISDVVESSGKAPQMIRNDKEFTVLAVDHPEKGRCFTVCSVAGANLVLQK